MATTCPRCARPLKKRDRTGHFAICCPYELEPDAWAGGDRQTVATLLRAKYDGAEWTALDALLGLERSRIENADAVARRAGWPRERALGLLHTAMRSLPLPADASVPIRVIHRDAHVLVVDKPPGYEVSPAKRLARGSMVNGAVAHVGHDVYPAHRLDRDTSGCLCFALDKASARRLGASFQRNLVHKEYLAVVSGDVLASQDRRDFTVTARICEVDGDTSVRSTVQSDGCRSQEALTTMRVLGTSAGSSYSLLLAKPTTGRTHQIRVHCASIGHPLVADAPYKGAEHAEMPRQALHALRLRLPHPDGDAELKAYAPPPDDLRKLCAAVGIDLDAALKEAGLAG